MFEYHQTFPVVTYSYGNYPSRAVPIFRLARRDKMEEEVCATFGSLRTRPICLKYFGRNMKCCIRFCFKHESRSIFRQDVRHPRNGACMLQRGELTLRAVKLSLTQASSLGCIWRFAFEYMEVAIFRSNIGILLRHSHVVQ